MGVINDSLNLKLKDINNRLRDGGLSSFGNGPENTAMNFTPPSNELNELFRKSSTTYSGTDCTVVAIYNDDLIVLGNVATITYSVFREKNPVRTLGHIYPKNFVYGSRTIAGTIVFITFDNHPLAPLLRYFNKRTDYTHRYSTPLADDIPPFDIMLVFQNEYGAESVMKLYGVEVVNDGGVYSINDIYSENTMQFIAKDMDPMISGTDKMSTNHLMYLKMLQGKIVDFNLRSLLDYRRTLEIRIQSLRSDIDNLYIAGRGNKRDSLRYRNALKEKNKAWDEYSRLDGYTDIQTDQYVQNEVKVVPEDFTQEKYDKSKKDLIREAADFAAAKDSRNQKARERRRGEAEKARLKTVELTKLVAEMASIDKQIKEYEQGNLSKDMNASIETRDQLAYN